VTWAEQATRARPEQGERVHQERWCAAHAGMDARAAAGTEWALASADEHRSRRPEHAHSSERRGNGSTDVERAQEARRAATTRGRSISSSGGARALGDWQAAQEEWLRRR
jgi:hypothetical protein